ncbi:MAG TPA: nucleotidyltransferase family protein [Bacteroidales bacterium]|nr:nucleotidyltransferase family protein [Bacteroidales bacterium]
MINHVPVKNDERSGSTFSAVILASGLSERMGQPKALLKWDDSMTFIRKIVGEYVKAGCENVVCTVNRFIQPRCLSPDTFPNVKFVMNEHPEWGRLYAVKSGLAVLKDTSFCFIQNVDNPHITADIIRKMLENADPEAWCSPVYQGKSGHPVLLPGRITDQILQLTDPDTTLRDVLDLFPKKVVEMEDDAILKNINTPEDYRNFRNASR